MKGWLIMENNAIKNRYEFVMLLRKIAKECQNYGQRVQNSVFEIDVDYGTFLKVKDKLIDEESDSLRIYYLGNNWHRRVEHFGAKETYDPEGVLII